MKKEKRTDDGGVKRIHVSDVILGDRHGGFVYYIYLSIHQYHCHLTVVKCNDRYGERNLVPKRA